MDTDDLSDEVYYAVIIEAENFLHEMTLHFGVLASRCKDEEEYIQSALVLVDSLREASHNDYWDIFFGKTPAIKSVHIVLNKIEQNIQSVCKIPLTERTFSRWGMPEYVRRLKRIR